MTTPNSRPSVTPMASVLPVTWDRREVKNIMTPTYPVTSSMTRISPSQVGPPLDLPGTPPQPWTLLQPWAMHQMLWYAGGAGVRRVNTRRMAKAGRRPAPPRSTRRARTGRPGGWPAEEPPGQQHQPGHQQHRGDRVEPAVRDVAGLGCGHAAHAATRAAATANSTARPNRRGRSASRASTQTAVAPGQPGQPRRHLARLGPDRLGPVPPPRGAAAAPRPAAGHHPGQLAHGITPHRAASGRCRDATPRGSLYIDRLDTTHVEKNREPPPPAWPGAVRAPGA